MRQFRGLSVTLNIIHVDSYYFMQYIQRPYEQWFIVNFFQVLSSSLGSTHFFIISFYFTKEGYSF